MLFYQIALLGCEILVCLEIAYCTISAVAEY
jgi:hypothetical protein